MKEDAKTEDRHEWRGTESIRDVSEDQAVSGERKEVRKAEVRRM